MAKREGIPIEGREDSDYGQRQRGYEQAHKIRGDLREWARAWADWTNDLAGEVKTAIKEYPDDGAARFEAAKNAFDRFGGSILTAARGLIVALNKAYPPEEPNRIDEAKVILTDATKPPPPPFGGGKGDDDDQGSET